MERTADGGKRCANRTQDWKWTRAGPDWDMQARVWDEWGRWPGRRPGGTMNFAGCSRANYKIWNHVWMDFAGKITFLRERPPISAGSVIDIEIGA